MSEKQNSQMTNSSPFLPPVLEKIPQELREVPQWVAWMAASDPNKKKPDKVPVDAKTGKAGSTTRSETWTSFETAVAYYQKKLGTTHTIHTKAGGRNGPIAGVGFVLTEDSHIVGIDIDKCIDPQGGITPLAQQAVERVGSYAEVSPSGTGVHIFVKGNMPVPGFKKTAKGVEGYKSRRYLTVTGNILQDCPVVENQEALDWLVSEYGPDARKQEPAPMQPRFQAQAKRDDSALIEKALASKNGDRFRRLYIDGDMAGYSSQSEADLALCNILAFWTGKDKARMDRLFRSGALYREKWDEIHVRGLTYGEATIDKAISGTIDVCKATDTTSHVSEDSIASSFTARYAETLRFCKDWECWFEWNPLKHIWEQDKTNKVFDYARQECKSLNPKNKISLGKSGTAQGVERFARADPRHAITHELWDSDPFMLGTPEGTINLNIQEGNHA